MVMETLGFFFCNEFAMTLCSKWWCRGRSSSSRLVCSAPGQRSLLAASITSSLWHLNASSLRHPNACPHSSSNPAPTPTPTLTRHPPITVPPHLQSHTLRSIHSHCKLHTVSLYPRLPNWPWYNIMTMYQGLYPCLTCICSTILPSHPLPTHTYWVNTNVVRSCSLITLAGANGVAVGSSLARPRHRWWKVPVKIGWKNFHRWRHYLKLVKTL